MTTKSLSSGGSHVQISAPYSSSLGSARTERELKIFSTEVRIPATMGQRQIILYQLEAAKVLIRLLHETLHGLFSGKTLSNFSQLFDERVKALEDEAKSFTFNSENVKIEHLGVLAYAEDLGNLIDQLSNPQDRHRTNFGRVAPSKAALRISSIKEDDSESSHSSSQKTKSLRTQLLMGIQQEVDAGAYPDDVKDMMKMIEETLQLSAPKRIVAFV